MSAPKAPAGLGTAGAKLWREVTAAYELRPDEDRLLVAACRTLGELDKLERALAKAPAVIPGSKGQTRANPLFAEVRAHRLAFRQLIAGAGLDEFAGDQSGASRSHAGRQLAKKRWEKRRGAA